MVIVWTTGHIPVITWATPAIPPTSLGSSGPLGAVPLVPDFTPVSFSQAFTPSPLSGLILSQAADPRPAGAEAS